MNLAEIITSDSQVNVDGITQVFDYTDLIEDDVLYVDFDFNENKGYLEVRLTDPVFGGNEYEGSEITDFTEYNLIIDRFNNNRVTVKEAIQTRLNNVNVEYLSNEMADITVDDANSQGINFIYMDVNIAKEEKYSLLRDAGAEQSGQVYDSEDITAQTHARTMMNFSWSAINSKETLDPGDDDKILTYNEVLTYLDLIDTEFETHSIEIMELQTTQEVMDYVISFSPLPAVVSDNSNPIIQYIKRKRF